MKVLFLTDEFYPTFGANSLVVKNLAVEMLRNGIQVFVMPFIYDLGLPEETEYEGIRVVRKIPSDSSISLRNELKHGHIIRGFKMLMHYLSNKMTRNKHLKSKDRIFARYILRQFILENNIDTVISINCSIELGFPIYYLKKHQKVNVKWIMYMLDPFETHEYYRSHYSAKELRKTQHDMMNIADSVVATRIIKSEICEWENESIINKVIPLEFPKIEKAVIEPCNDAIVLDRDKTNIVCTGSKNETVRNSDYTLALCDKFPTVLFHFIGVGWADKQYFYKPNVIFYPPHSWSAIRKMQIEADYLLNIGNSVTNQLPSKVLEYISTGNPIINICKTNKCPTLDLLKPYDAIAIFEDTDFEDNVIALDGYLRAEHSTLDYSIIEKEYITYTPEYVANAFIRILKSLEEI